MRQADSPGVDPSSWAPGFGLRELTYGLSLLLIFTMSWERFAYVSGVGSLSMVIGLGVAGCWSVACLLSRHIARLSPLLPLVLIFFVWNAVSLFWSLSPDRTLDRMRTYAQMVVLLILLNDLYQTRERVAAGLQAYVWGLTVPIMTTIGNYFAGEQAVYGRYAADGAIANSTAVLIALGIPLAWHLAADASPTWWGFISRLVNYAIIPAAVFAIGLTATRFAMIMIVPAFVFGFLTLSRLRPAPRVGAFALLSLALLAVPVMLPQSSISRLSTTANELSSGDLTGRIRLWNSALKLWYDHPAIGIGCNAFDDVVAPVFGRSRSAHNTFLAVLVELGVIGFCLFLGVLGAALAGMLILPKWDLVFWVTVGAVWTLGNCAVTWLHNQPTWFLIALLSCRVSQARRVGTPSAARTDV